MEEMAVKELSVLESKVVCKRCHRPLKDEISKKLGFGRICYQKYLNRKKVYLFDMEVHDEAITKRTV